MTLKLNQMTDCIVSFAGRKRVSIADIQPLDSYVLQPLFITHTVWLCLLQLRFYYFIGNLNTFLNRMLNNDIVKGTHFQYSIIYKHPLNSLQQQQHQNNHVLFKYRIQPVFSMFILIVFLSINILDISAKQRQRVRLTETPSYNSVQRQTSLSFDQIATVVIVMTVCPVHIGGGLSSRVTMMVIARSTDRRTKSQYAHVYIHNNVLNCKCRFRNKGR